MSHRSSSAAAGAAVSLSSIDVVMQAASDHEPVERGIDKQPIRSTSGFKQQQRTSTSHGSKSKVRSSHSATSSTHLSTSSRRGGEVPPMKEEEVLLANITDFANPLHLDDDDINLYLVAEMLREKKRKTGNSAEVSYREPYSIPSVSTSPKSQSLQSRVAASKSHAPSSAASAPSYTHGPSVAPSMAPSNTTISNQSTQQLKSRSHRSSHASSHRARAAGAAVPTSVASLASSAASSTVSPSGSSIQARKRGRSKSRNRQEQAAEMAELEKFEINITTPFASPQQQLRQLFRSHDHAMEDVTSHSAEVLSLPTSSKDVEMESHDSSDEIQIQFHDDTSSCSVPQASQSPSVASSSPVKTTFSSLSQEHLAAVLRFTSLSEKAVIMGVCASIRDLLLSSSPPGASSWVSSCFRCQGKLLPSVFSKLHQTYGVQEQHATWIIPPNPPQSFLPKNLEEMDLSDELHPPIVHDAHFVLLPYFTSLQVLNLSYVGARNPQLTAASSSTHRLTGVLLSRVALLPKLHTLLLDHCDWVDDLGLACLRNKEHAAMVVSMQMGSGAQSQQIVRFLPPANSLPTLTHLSLEFCSKITTRGLEYLIGMNGAPQLKKLNLAHCPRVITLESAAAMRWNTPLLQELNLAWCGSAAPSSALTPILPSPSFSLSESLRPFFSMTSLYSLDLRGWSSLRDDLLQQFTHPGNCILGPVIRRLSLKECSGLSSTGVNALVQLTSLTALDLSDCRGLSDSVLMQFGQYLIHLEELVMWNAAAITDRGMEGLLMTNQGDQNANAQGQAQMMLMQPFQAQFQAQHQPQFSLIPSRSQPTAQQPQFRSLSQTLRRFRISSNPLLTPHSCSLLARCEKLVELEISDVTALGDAGLHALSSQERPLRASLKILHAARLGSWFTNSAVGALVRFTELEQLDVSWNDGFDDSVLHSVLSHTRGLKKLNLSRCPITDGGLAMLATHSARLRMQSGEQFEVDLKYCPHLSSAGVAMLKRDGRHPKVEENLSEYVQTPPPPISRSTRTAPPNHQSAAMVLSSPLEVSNSGSPEVTHRPLSHSTPTPSSNNIAYGFRIEDQVVADDSGSEEGEDEDGEDDDDEDDDSDGDESMTGEPLKYIEAGRVEQDEQGESWDVHD